MLRLMSPESPIPARRRDAFTLIELLVVITIIAILAALTLSTMGYVQKKGARSRAEAEVAALSAAIDSYKLDVGDYPLMDVADSTSLSNVTTTNLYKALCPTGGGKIYFEPSAGMVTNDAFIDPWGNRYNYRTNTNGNVLTNVGFFDLWSTAGGDTNKGNWIRN